MQIYYKQVFLSQSNGLGFKECYRVFILVPQCYYPNSKKKKVISLCKMERECNHLQTNSPTMAGLLKHDDNTSYQLTCLNFRTNFSVLCCNNLCYIYVAGNNMQNEYKEPLFIHTSYRLLFERCSKNLHCNIKCFNSFQSPSHTDE